MLFPQLLIFIECLWNRGFLVMIPKEACSFLVLSFAFFPLNR